MYRFSTSFTLIYLCILLISCDDKNKNANQELPEKFQNYWHTGKAEVSSYQLKQARYGEIREGHAVLIFVTEDINNTTHIKLDNPKEDWSDKVNVLKLNFIKKFNTGIYPYSMMMSVFSPVNIESYPKPLKISMSVQEWCGHVFTQLNLNGGKYDVQQNSYFESEGDENFTIDTPELMEDEIWNRIRLDYGSLSEGNVKILPGIMSSRLKHTDIKSIEATAKLTSDGDTLNYTIDYSPSHRLEINFTREFPHKILSWTETEEGSTGEILTTQATLKETLHIDYWTKNKNEHLYFRDSLGLGLN